MKFTTAYLGNGERIKDRGSIVDQVVEGGFLGFCRRIGQSVSSEIGCNDSETGVCDGNHLVAPSVPYLRESVKEYHRRRGLGAELSHVKLQPVDL